MKNDAATAPHEPLTRYYHSEPERRQFLNGVFDRTAVHYDRIESLMSAGTGARYRRWALVRAGLSVGMRHLDVAIGTGLVAAPATTIVGPTGVVVGVDPSAGMLAQARRKLPVAVLRGIAERLPVASTSFDFLSMGYALRHVTDLGVVFAEYFRVLRPGGRVLLLEFSRPQSAIGGFLARFYFQRLVPGLSWLGARDREARLLMQYCAATVDRCVEPETIVAALQSAGFSEIQHRRFGLVCEYSARRPGLS